MVNFPKHFVVLILFVVSFVIFSQNLNIHGVEYRDDEIFYYKSTTEMVEDNNYLSPTYFGDNRFQKPILFYWFILLSYKIFGVNWFAARVVSSFFAALTVVFNWLFVRRIFNDKIAYLSSLIVMTSPLFFRHAKNAVPDMTLYFFILLAFYYSILFLENPKSTKNSIMFFVSCSLGFLIKGFAALVVPIVPFIIYALSTKQKYLLKDIRFLRGLGVFLAIVLPWFLFMIVKHGMSYLTYMVVDETQNRLVRDMEGGALLFKIKEFFSHASFYFQVILSNFAPWSVFFLLAVVFGYAKCKGRESENALKLMWFWLMFVYLLFSAMSYKISHYMLVLITPLSVIISYYLLDPISEKQKSKWKTSVIIQKSLMVLIFVTIVVAFSVLLVFLLGWPKWFLSLVLVVVFLGLRAIIFSRSKIVAPLVVGVLICFVFAQSAVISEAGVSSHTRLRKFADKVNVQLGPDDVIGVGSHDIHEKEWQVYFDRQVVKAANDNDQVTRYYLKQLFSTDHRVYCLMTEEDFGKYVENKYTKSVEIIMQDYMIRKRMDLDKGFFKALIQLDQKKVYGYLMEKIVLIKGEADA